MRLTRRTERSISSFVSFLVCLTTLPSLQKRNSSSSVQPASFAALWAASTFACSAAIAAAQSAPFSRC